MIAVLDSNVLVSAVLQPSGSPGRVVQALAVRRFIACTTDHLWSEFVNVMGRPRIQRLLAKRGPGAKEIDDILGDLKLLMDFVPSVEPTTTWIQGDADDDWVVQCAVTSQADVIVSGDAHFQRAKPTLPVTIKTPSQFLADLAAV